VDNVSEMDVILENAMFNDGFKMDFDFLIQIPDFISEPAHIDAAFDFNDFISHDSSPLTNAGNVPESQHVNVGNTIQDIPCGTNSAATVTTTTVSSDSRKTQKAPARFCHKCWASEKNRKLIVCYNYHNGTCRKVECENCIESDGGHYTDRVCRHCRGTCPPKSQCYVYGSNNASRSLVRERNRIERHLKKSKRQKTRSGHISC